MNSFCKIKIEIFFSIHPRFLSDPSQSIYHQLKGCLFKYSKSLNGFPLSFSLEGVTPWGQILDDGSVYVNTLVEFCVLKIVPGDSITSHEGLLMNVFPCIVDEDESFTGSFRFTGVEKGNKIQGTTIRAEEF